ncbi:MAG: glycosyltransferase [Desulfurococcaceae archaeon]
MVALFYYKLEKFGGIRAVKDYVKQALSDLGIRAYEFSWNDRKYMRKLRDFVARKTIYGNLSGRLLDYTCFKRLDAQLEQNNILTFNVHGEWLFLPTRIVYIHDPELLVSTFVRHSPLSIVRRAYYIPHNIISKNLVNLYGKSLVVVNSNFSATQLKRLTGLDSQVLYPPVDMHKYRNCGLHDKPWVLTISRFSRFKQLNKVLEVAKQVRDAKFFICGGVNSEDESHYFWCLKHLIDKENIKNVFLLPNASEQIKAYLMSRSKAYFHPKENEQFGASIVEAMSSGLIPIVHKSGGPWEDILGKKQGIYGFAYTNLEEAVSFIMLVLSDYSHLTKIMMLRNRAQDFSYEDFKLKLMSLVNRLK